MSLPMKGLAEVKTDLAEIKRKFSMFSARCDHSVVKDGVVQGQTNYHNRAACCSHEGYDVIGELHCLCLLDRCPVIQGKGE